MVLVRPVGTIFPDAVAMISTWPTIAHPIAIAKNRMIVPATIRPTGDAGVSRTSRAAGKNWRAVSSGFQRGRAGSARSFSLTASTDDMHAALQLMKLGLAAR